MNNTDVWNSNDIDSIDRKINQSAIDDLDGVESSLNHIDKLDDEEWLQKRNTMLNDKIDVTSMLVNFVEEYYAKNSSF